MARLAVEFCILTALRIGTVRKAKRLDVTGDLWVIPDETLKVEDFHNVPLPPRCIEIVKRARELAPDSEYLFAGEQGGRMSANAIDTAWKAIHYYDKRGDHVVLHGFRSTFGDWAQEETSFPKTVTDVALAHSKEEVDAAYFRSALLKKRRELMTAWANHAEGRDNIRELRATA